MSSVFHPRLRPSDFLASAVEAYLHGMEADGYGKLSTRVEGDSVLAGFGGIESRGETIDVALLRLASALLDDARLSAPFCTRMRDSARDLLATPPSDRQITTRTAAGKR